MSRPSALPGPPGKASRMTAHETVPATSPRQENRPSEPLDRARRLYAYAREIETRSVDERCREMARDVALMAMDLMVEARGGVAA